MLLLAWFELERKNLNWFMFIKIILLLIQVTWKAPALSGMAHNKNIVEAGGIKGN